MRHRFQHSALIVNWNLTLFQLPPMDYCVDEIQWIEYRPLAPVMEDFPNFKKHPNEPITPGN